MKLFKFALTPLVENIKNLILKAVARATELLKAINSSDTQLGFQFAHAPTLDLTLLFWGRLLHRLVERQEIVHRMAAKQKL